VRYEPVDHSVRLANVSLNRFAVPGVPEQVANSLQQVARVVAETLLESLSVYRMPQGVARLIDTLGTAPSELKVTSTGVAVAFRQIGA
jgi:spore germination cell wall hydrolase CwlJ-like protein